MNDTKILKYALQYARHGWLVLPLAPKGKAPFGKLAPNGVKNASKDENTIKSWFGDGICNIGIATGGGSQIWVLDIDGPVGCLVWWDWEAKNGHVFTTAQRTGRPDGGRQLFFKYPKNHIIKSCAGIMSGIDVRGDHGYVVAPPSIHPSGRRYVWEGKAPTCTAPTKLIELVGTKRLPTSPARTRPRSLYSNYGRKTEGQLLDDLGSCPRGGRDQKGYRVAVRMLELERSGDVPPGAAEEVLRIGLARCGFMSDERRERGERGFLRILSSAQKKINQ